MQYTIIAIISLGMVRVNRFAGRRSTVNPGKAPLHVQLADSIRAQVAAGVFRPGDQLPTERELMETYGLSSSTVRQGVLALVREGLLYRKAGKGTFVAQPPIARDLLSFSGFSEEALARGFTPGSRLVTANWCSPSPTVSAELAVDEGDKVYAIERVRTVDREVVALESVWLPPRFGQDVSKYNLTNTSLTTILEHELKLKLARAEQAIRATSANARLSRLLEVKQGAPLLQIDRTAVLADDRVVYFSSSHYRADRYVYSGWIERRAGSVVAMPGVKLVGRAS
jgi:GntR family transcriptional regulator